jgi:hypothetical protein
MEEHPVMATVLVKCPAVLNPATTDYTLQISMMKTVADLKSCLNRRHPCRPDYADQRLVFRGQILNDSVIVANMCEKVCLHQSQCYSCLSRKTPVV